MKISFAVMKVMAFAMLVDQQMAVRLNDEVSSINQNNDVQVFAQDEEMTLAQSSAPANVVVIDQSRSAFGGGNLAGPHIMDSISKALARSFGSNPSAGPAPEGGAAQVDTAPLPMQTA